MTSRADRGEAAPALSSTTKLALLSSLYFSQGLPFGFFVQALPVWMREAGMELKWIGLSSALALPWALKLLWAPVVDRYGSATLGRRRGWILPLQLASILLAAGLAGVGAGTSATGSLLVALAIGAFLTNMVAATQDIATDGLAVDLLSSSERGLGNGVQVAAYRVGMIVGGGGLLVVLQYAGWPPTFFAIALLLGVATVPLLRHREAPWTPPKERVAFHAQLQFFTRNGGKMLVWCCAIALYKLGDGFGSNMVKPLLVDRGWTMAEIGVLVGTAGSIAGLVGALLGGAVARRGRLLALVVCGLVHAALMGGYALAVDAGVGSGVVAGLLILEHLTGGMATVSLFTAMMDAADPKTGATDYTVQASVVVWGSGIGSAVAGFSADAVGYAAHFGVAGLLCVLGTLAMIPVYRLKIAPRDPAFDDELAHVELPTGAVSSTTTAAVPPSRRTERP